MTGPTNRKAKRERAKQRRRARLGAEHEALRELLYWEQLDQWAEVRRGLPDYEAGQ